ncbi:glycosyl hydrolase family 28-related protein [Sphingobium sp. Cam5-1]|uniref:glycosyl hydrolase family 28-related protein n=1 Tax=Sphingobium sp. Cam5-1 TaxID=2789327 RepID=UPI0018AD19F3|nr:glycosyl hydrolase family 28-related protein [Sphingobium sp. Cam5-1]QPI73941.1 hypothetical protein IZV00_05610 [Sphingobium sp. Cam5-1]
MSLQVPVRDRMRGLRGESQADILRRTGQFGVLPTDTDEQAVGKLNAVAAASAALAESAAGPTYPDTGAGLAATTDGQAFAVDNGDGTVTIYLNDGGVAVAQRTLFTTAYAASPDGAAAIGSDDDTGGVKWSNLAQALQYIQPGGANAMRWGVVGDGSTDNTDNLNDAIEALYQEFGGGTLYLPLGDIRIEGPILWRTGVNIKGIASQRPGGSDITRIVTDSSDIFQHGYGAYLGGEMSNLELLSEIGGGHLFKTSVGQSRSHIHHVNLYQRNPDKSILSAVHGATDGYYGNWWSNFNAEYAVENEVPAFHVECGNTINQNVFREFRIGRPAISKSGTYAFDFHSTAATIASGLNLVDQATFQQPGGGAVRMRGLRESRVRQSGVWDLTSGSLNPLFYFGINVNGLRTQRSGLDQVYCSFNGADPTTTDVFVEADGTGNIFIDYSQIGKLAGNDPTNVGAGVSNRGSQINTVQDIAVTEYDARYGYTRRQAAAMIQTFQQAVGYPMSNDGFMRWLINNAYVGGMDSTGRFLWGGTPSSPGMRIGTDGTIFAKEFRQLTSQAKISWGTGAPNGVVEGYIGSIYFNLSGGAGTTMYVKESGNPSNTGWVAK